MIDLPRLILASGSPRRAQILKSVGWDFTRHVADINEDPRQAESPADYVVRLAREKAEAVAGKHPAELILGADTTVVIDEAIMGKPADLDAAKAMLGMLAGRTHEVLTGVALTRSGVTRTGIQCTQVKFAAMSDEEIHFLAETGDPLDKAGGYAVQAQAALFIEGIDGDYWNVVGLPIRRVYEIWREF